MQTKKILQRIAIILLIAAFSIAGIVACGGNDATNPTGSFSQSEGYVEGPQTPGNDSSGDTTPSNPGTPSTPDTPTEPGDTNPEPGPEQPEQPEEPVINDNNGDTGNTWNIEQTKGKTYYGASYRGIYLRGASPTPWMSVSYNDTDRLTRMWKWTIDGGIRDGKRRKYIKSRNGDFFFDANYNIRWSKKPETVLKWFQGGAITRLREGYGDNEFSSIEEQRDSVRFSGNYTIGGLYTFAMHASEAASLNSDVVNEFFWAKSTLQTSERFGGRMEILVLHPGYPLDKGTGKYKGLWAGSRPGQGWTGEAWAAQSYAAKWHTGYGDGNGNGVYNIKGNSPERYEPHLNAIHQIYHLYFRWVVDEVYNPESFYVNTVYTGKTYR